MKTYARIQDDKVVEVIAPMVDANENEIAIERRFHPDFVATLVEIQEGADVEERWVFENGAFSPPVGPALDVIQLQLIDDIDNTVAHIYSGWTRFESEYLEREAAAQAFIAAGYEGDAGPWVMSYANSAGKTAQQAADTIIVQAQQLRGALATLATLRMRKYEIKNAVSEVDARAKHAEIVGEIGAVASTLK